MSIHEPPDRHFDIPDTFQEYLRHDSGKDDHERILISDDPYMTTFLKGSKFWLADVAFKVSPPKTSIKLRPFMYALTRNFVRNIGELGLKKLVSENHAMALAFKMIPSLALKM